MRRRHLTLPLLFGLVLCSACYTLLEHPQTVRTESHAAGDTGASLLDCRDCHADFEYSLYHPGSRWRRPYARRWWYDDYWLYDGGGYDWDPSYTPPLGDDGRPLPVGEWDASRRRKRDEPAAEGVVPGSSAGQAAKPAEKQDANSSSGDTKDDEKPKQKDQERKRRKKRGQ